jgi:hypothetical protein
VGDTILDFPKKEDSPFDCSHNYANGNMAANMYANVTPEATGRVLQHGCMR